MPEAQQLIELIYIRRLPWYEVCEKMAIEKSTFYEWRKNLIIFVALLACQEGLATLGTNKIVNIEVI